MVSAKLIFNFHSNLDFAYLPLTRARQRAGRPDPQKNLIVNPETAPKPGPGRPGPLPSHAPDCCMKLRKNGKCIDKVGKSILRDILINLNFHFYSNLNLTQNSLEQEGTIIMLVKHKNKSVEGPFEVVLQLAKKGWNFKIRINYIKLDCLVDRRRTFLDNIYPHTARVFPSLMWQEIRWFFLGSTVDKILLFEILIAFMNILWRTVEFRKKLK